MLFIVLLLVLFFLMLYKYVSKYTKHFTKLIEIKIKGNISCPALNGLWDMMFLSFFASSIQCFWVLLIFPSKRCFDLPALLSLCAVTWPSPSPAHHCFVYNCSLSVNSLLVLHSLFICCTNFLTSLFCPVTTLLRNLSPSCPMQWSLTPCPASFSGCMPSVDGSSCALWK